MVKILYTLILCSIWLADQCAWSLPYDVHVTNNLPDPLVLHCKSEDDDLGTHYLAPNQQFNWKFNMHISMSTFFSCDLWWGKKHGLLYAFNWQIAQGYCDKHWWWFTRNQCNWFIRKDAFYIQDTIRPENGLQEEGEWDID